MRTSLSTSRKMPHQFGASALNFSQKLRTSDNNNSFEDKHISMLQSKLQVKRFKESISLGGKNIGVLKGTFKISNTPLLQ